MNLAWCGRCNLRRQIVASLIKMPTSGCRFDMPCEERFSQLRNYPSKSLVPKRTEDASQLSSGPRVGTCSKHFPVKPEVTSITPVAGCNESKQRLEHEVKVQHPCNFWAPNMMRKVSAVPVNLSRIRTEQNAVEYSYPPKKNRKSYAC